MIPKNRSHGVSVDTHGPTITKTKSILIRECACGVRFEVRSEFQSLTQCPDCRKPRRCVHNVSTVDRCITCFQRHGNWFMRTM